MPEYFDISFVTPKSENQKEVITAYLLRTFNLHEGENNIKESYYEIFLNKKVYLGIYEDNETDFLEFCISLSNCTFHKENFEIEWRPFSLFIQDCFTGCNQIKFAFCSYEINSYYIWKEKKLASFESNLFPKLPIICVKKSGTLMPVMILNFQAQNIFED